jgi:hypothetical protein
MEQQPVAEVLPGLYRAVLDAVGLLELQGLRREAATIRADATEAYSGAWNDAAARRMRTLAARAEKVMRGRRGPRGRRFPAEHLDRRVDLERTTV